MKRFITIVVFLMAAAALFAMPTSAAKDTKGPACANFVAGDGGYARNATDDSGALEVTMTLDAPACADVEYVLTIYPFTSGGEGKPLVKNIEPTSVEGNVVFFTYSFEAGEAPDDGVCVVVESFWRGHVADRAPDSGCSQFAAGSAGGGEGFN